MSLVVTGASGALGRLAVAALLDRVDAAELILVSRSPDALADAARRGATVRYGDFERPASLRRPSPADGACSPSAPLARRTPPRHIGARSKRPRRLAWSTSCGPRSAIRCRTIPFRLPRPTREASRTCARPVSRPRSCATPCTPSSACRSPPNTFTTAGGRRTWATARTPSLPGPTARPPPPRPSSRATQRGASTRSPAPSWSMRSSMSSPRGVRWPPGRSRRRRRRRLRALPRRFVRRSGRHVLRAVHRHRRSDPDRPHRPARRRRAAAHRTLAALTARGLPTALQLNSADDSIPGFRPPARVDRLTPVPGRLRKSVDARGGVDRARFRSRSVAPCCASSR